MAEDVIDNEDAPVQSGGGLGKMLAFGGVGIVLLAIGIFLGPVVTNMISPPPPPEAETEEVTEPSIGPAFYTSLHPPLVVNFDDSFGDSHVMQLTLEVMAPSQTIVNAVREHTPVIRNNLILLYSSAVYEEVATREGKEKMLADGLAEIQKVMTEKIGEPGVEAVYFTGLVIQ
jgi:flagellar FliL protein